MNQDRSLSWPMTVIMCLCIAIFGGGTMALLIQRIDVPGALWAIVGGLVNSIVSLGGFFNMRQMHAAALWHLAQSHLAATAQAAATAATNPTIRTGSQEADRP